jgi:flavin-binding protein dodecin
MASIRRVSEISALSAESFQDAINQGIAYVRPFGEVASAWVKEQRVNIHAGATEYQVNLLVTFSPLEGKPTPMS